VLSGNDKVVYRLYERAGAKPQPERCAEYVLGNDDGRLIFLSMLDTLKKAKLQPKTVVARGSREKGSEVSYAAVHGG